MLSSKRAIKPVKTMLEHLNLERIPALQRKFNLLKNMLEKVERIYSFDQINCLFQKQAALLSRMRQIFIKLEWKKQGSQKSVPVLFDEISIKLDTMIKDKNYLEKEQFSSFITREARAILDRYNQKLDEEELIRAIDVFMHIFREMLEEFDHSYKALDIGTFIEITKSAKQCQVDAFQRICHQLNEQLDQSIMNDDFLLLYQQKKIQLVSSQTELHYIVDAKLMELDKDSAVFKSKYKGSSVSDIFAKDNIQLSKLKLVANEVLAESKELEYLPSYRYHVALCAKTMQMRQVLQFLQENVLHDDVVKMYWSKCVKSFNFGCFFIGGSKVTLKDRSHIIVADGIASLYRSLAKVDLHHYDAKQIEALFNTVTISVSNRLRSKGIGRYNKVNQLYQFILKLGDSASITSDKVTTFYDDISTLHEIIPIKKSSLAVTT